MSKHELIDAIRRRNSTADPGYLMMFDEAALEQYARRLALVDRRGAESAWVREGQCRSVVTRRPRRRAG